MTGRTHSGCDTDPAARAPAPALVLVKPLRARLGSLMLGHLSGIFVCGLAMERPGGPWPTTFMVASIAILVARLGVLQQGNPALGGTADPDARRWVYAYQTVGLIWAVISATLCAWCVAAVNSGVTGLLGVALAYGTSGGIAARNAGTPGFAIVQLVIWLLPLMFACSWHGADYWPLMLLTACYLASVIAVVRQHHRDLRSLIAADGRSRAAQAALAAREADLRAIFENAAAGVVEADYVIHRILRVNPLFCRMTGRSEAELLDLSIADVTHPDDRAAEADHLGVHDVGTKFYYQKRYLHPDGTIVWVQASACVMAVQPDGRVARMVVLTQDCTQQKAAEAALLASEAMLRLSLDVGRIGTYERDYAANIIRCGQQTRLMSGLPPGDAPINDSVWLETVMPEDRDRLIAELQACYAARRELAGFEYRFLDPVDGMRHIACRTRIEYDDAGRPLRSLGVVIDVTERRQAEARIAHLAHHDALTDLPNRALFGERLDAALARARRGEPFALCCVDLDRFKEINDTLGHPIGDALLRAVTARLQAAIRPTDTLARLGGDEFALIQTQLSRPEDASDLAARLLATLDEPFELDGYHVVADASIGIAIAPDDGTDAESLLRRADMALYAAKAEGRGRSIRFERHMDADLQARRTLERDLRQALETEAFELFYQPVVNVADHTVCGFEALLRWHHPTRGMVPPDRFIPLAEATGLVLPIGAWALHQACAEAASWPHRARVAVNLSAVQFTGDPLVQTVREALHASNLDPSRLELEITETAMLQDTEATLATLHALKSLGVTIAMDDFGTGYSSLGYLQRFPFDKVKIDRSFTTHLSDSRESAAIVSAVVDLCGSLDMRTTAEGVETKSQLGALALAGCDQAQGYYFSPPRPAAEIPTMIERIGRMALLAPAAE